jgi:dihydroorotase-like cyclic amidohydrolase
MLRLPGRGEIGVTEQTTAFADAMIFDGVSNELREGCVRVAAGTIVEVGEGPEPGDRVIDCHGRSWLPQLAGCLVCVPA